MRVVLLSGGSGKRLWPMSNDSRSKQFLKVLKTEDNQSISMLQRVWQQMKNTGLDQQAYVCAAKAQLDIITHQIGDVPLIEEPMRRDTFPAISLATLYLLDEVGCDENEVIAVVPVDHFVDDHYFEQILRLETILQKSHADLALMGVQPFEATNKFGYISVYPFADSAEWRKVDRFVEKPDCNLAQKLIAEGALWNCGVFCFRAGYLRNQLTNRGFCNEYHAFIQDFSGLPKRSFDYEVVERAESVVVLPYHGTWKDLGTWSALSEEMGQSMVGNGTSMYSENTHVINELGIPLVSVGIQDAIVVATPDGILVANKEESANIKNIVQIFEGRPMFEERKWGTYRVLDYQKLADGTEVLTKCIELHPNSNISYQKHMKRSEVWTMIEGSGEVVLDTHHFPVSAGDVVRIYAEQWHAVRAHEAMKFIEVQRGSELIEEDIVRRYLSWEDIRNVCAIGRHT